MSSPDTNWHCLEMSDGHTGIGEWPATRNQWVEARDVYQPPTVHRTAPSNMNHPAWNIGRTKVRNPVPGQWFSNSGSIRVI